MEANFRAVLVMSSALDFNSSSSPWPASLQIHHLHQTRQGRSVAVFQFSCVGLGEWHVDEARRSRITPPP
jgi:hypothetical protein